MAKSRKKVWEPIETAPAHKEIVVLTDLGGTLPCCSSQEDEVF